MSWYDDWENDNEDRLEELGRAHYANFRKDEIKKRLEQIETEKDKACNEISESSEKFREDLKRDFLNDEDILAWIDAEIEVLQKRKKFHQLRVEEKNLRSELDEINHELDL